MRLGVHSEQRGAHSGARSSGGASPQRRGSGSLKSAGSSPLKDYDKAISEGDYLRALAATLERAAGEDRGAASPSPSDVLRAAVEAYGRAVEADATSQAAHMGRALALRGLDEIAQVELLFWCEGGAVHVVFL